MSLDATVGGASSNSYVTLAEAESYFEDRINQASAGNWELTSASVQRTNAEKSAALVTATRRLDEEQFRGDKVSTTQALKWPRYDANDEDGYPFSTTAIPEPVKQATYLVALELLRADFLQEDYMDGISYLQTGSVQIKRFTQTSTGKLPSEARRLLRYLMLSSGGGRVVRA